MYLLWWHKPLDCRTPVELHPSYPGYPCDAWPNYLSLQHRILPCPPSSLQQSVMNYSHLQKIIWKTWLLVLQKPLLAGLLLRQDLPWKISPPPLPQNLPWKMSPVLLQNLLRKNFPLQLPYLCLKS
ncbi:hypothetical protein CPC08DRAFT_90639 [Agrocybe pediades]|nr:hypothetical protein CPC08DRAFT_90639 [Agrocybe pediades]